ncbi:unnamed protein product [Haemonchus placei]|uniref:Uncharacterized protein n=1 Tax=Haemonchus placei TaxID=6290 RepID=A0A0N4X5T8_HAEPC|nr:unnamed protein product [Haemonchus placei]
MSRKYIVMDQFYAAEPTFSSADAVSGDADPEAVYERTVLRLTQWRRASPPDAVIESAYKSCDSGSLHLRQIPFYCIFRIIEGVNCKIAADFA